MLVQQVTGRSVPERGLPLNVGAVVENVGTVLSIADALEDKPVTEKYLSVTGAVREPVMFKVPLGTPIRRIINQVDLRAKRSLSGKKGSEAGTDYDSSGKNILYSVSFLYGSVSKRTDWS